jgi:hypothetical protein
VKGDIQDHKSWEKSRPPLWEQNAISLLLELAREEQKEAHPGFQIHIAHMSDTGSLSAIAAAKREGTPPPPPSPPPLQHRFFFVIISQRFAHSYIILK